MILSQLIGVSLFVLAACIAAWNYWPRKSTTRVTDDPQLLRLGSDAAPPEGTNEYINAILNACGDRVPDDFKISVLRKSPTIATALIEARCKVEQMMGKPS